MDRPPLLYSLIKKLIDAGAPVFLRVHNRSARYAIKTVDFRDELMFMSMHSTSPKDSLIFSTLCVDTNLADRVWTIAKEDGCFIMKRRDS